jgi:5-methylcytosine-specific restriction endonuclease McrA
MMGRCELCEREGMKLTRHHLIPRTRHSTKRNKKLFSRQEVVERIAMLCRPCHRQVHALFTEKQLELEYSSLDRLLAHPEVAKFVAWIRSKPPGFQPSTRQSSLRVETGPRFRIGGEVPMIN